MATTQIVKSPSGKDLRVGNPVAERTVAMFAQQSNIRQRPTKKRRMDGYGAYEGINRVPSSPPPSRGNFQQGSSRERAIDLANSPQMEVNDLEVDDIELDDSRDELDFLSEKNHYAMDDIVIPSNFHRANEDRALRPAKTRPDGGRLFQMATAGVFSQIQKEKVKKKKVVIEIDQPSTILAEQPRAGLVSDMVKRYDKFENIRDEKEANIRDLVAPRPKLKPVQTRKERMRPKKQTTAVCVSFLHIDCFPDLLGSIGYGKNCANEGVKVFQGRKSYRIAGRIRYRNRRFGLPRLY